MTPIVLVLFLVYWISTLSYFRSFNKFNSIHIRFFDLFRVRVPVLEDLRNVLQRILNENPEERIVLMGDFNMSHEAYRRC